MKTFKLIRDVDHTGLSGTGTVAEGVEFSDGTVALRWLDIDHDSENYQRGVRPTTVIHESIDAVIALHGHNGSTRIIAGNLNQSTDSEARDEWIREQLIEAINKYAENPDNFLRLPLSTFSSPEECSVFNSAVQLTLALVRNVIRNASLYVFEESD